MAESFDFIKQLINAERYKDYKKDEWGGCDVIIVSSARYKDRKRTLDDWGNRGCHKLVINDYAKSIIWLIETLKPYVNYDYLSKYDYYSKIAELIDQQKEKIKDEKNFLLSIVQFLEEKQNVEKILIDTYLERNSLMTWYNFGIDHNDPFFVKFVALWMAFNKEYISYPGVLNYYNKKTNKTETRYNVEYKKIDEFCEDPKNFQKLRSVYTKVFNSSLIDIFMVKPVEDMK